VTFTIAPVDGQTRDVDVTSGVYVQNTVPNTFVYTNGNNKIGYIEFTRFLRPSEAALDNSLANLLNEQITDLVLDLRYNGGGFTYIARKLASQIAGPDFVGQTMYRNTFNEKYSSRNEIREFELQRLNLSLPRVIILTTGSTASSSEIVANSLKPYLDVVLIGSRTNGKPFTSSGRVNCGQVLNAMEITRTNSAGESVLGGLEPTCEVIDTYNHEQGSIDDSLIGGMLTYVIDGVCPTAIIADSSNEAEVRKARNQFSSLEFDEFNVRGGVLVETLAAPTD